MHKNTAAIRQAFHDRGSQAIKDILLTMVKSPLFVTAKGGAQ